MKIISELWDRLLAISTSSDLALNLSTELVGVLLSIPLSVLIAFSLDKAAERRRMKRSLEAIVAEVRHELSYFLEELPNVVSEKAYPDDPGRVAYLTVVWAAQISNRAIQPSIVSVRSTFGDRLSPDLRQSLSRLSWAWNQVEVISKMSVPIFRNNKKSNEENTQLIVENYQYYFKVIARRIEELEDALNRRSDLQELYDQIDEAVEKYPVFISPAFAHVSETYHETGN
ncbi:MAG: hypothetical protein AAGD92_05615 [Pseudomonadota bacterium]